MRASKDWTGQRVVAKPCDQVVQEIPLQPKFVGLAFVFLIAASDASFSKFDII